MDKLFHRPLNPFVLNQGFGENRSCVDVATNSKVITCDGNKPPSGYRSLYGTKGHLGIDLKAYHGQEVYCSQKGIVYSIDTNPKSGLDVKVISLVGGRDFIHIYEHLLGYQVKVGDAVETGQLLGWANNTGYSSGDHLHFEIKERLSQGYVSIDPLPLMSNLFAKEVLFINNKMKYVQEQVAMLLDKITDWLRK